MNTYIFAIDICHQPNEHWYAVHMGENLMDAIQKLLNHEDSFNEPEEEPTDIKDYISDGFIDMAVEIRSGEHTRFYQQQYNTDTKGYELKETYKDQTNAPKYEWAKFLKP